MKQKKRKIKKPEPKPKQSLSFSELGKLGAAALNGDPVKKAASILKGLETKRKKQLQAKIAEIEALQDNEGANND